MKCLVCKIEMQEGTLNNGVFWVKGFSGRRPLSEGMSVCAWRCPVCGKIELSTEVELGSVLDDTKR